VTLAADVAAAALEAAAGDDVEAIVVAEHSGLARFATSEVHQPTLIENVAVTLRVVRDGRTGLGSTNRIDEAGLGDLAARAREAADSAPRDDGFPGLAPPEPLPEVVGFDESTAALGPDDQARLAASAIAAATNYPIYGYFTSGATEIAVASSEGVSATQQLTDATSLVIAAGDGASGYAEQTSWTAGEVDPVAVTQEADEKAARTVSAATLDPGPYRAVLEPYAFAELLQYFAYDSFGAQGLLEKRSYLSGRIGEQVFDPRVSIADDALDPRGLPKAFDFEGTPKQRVELVEGGVARGVVWDRATAAQAGDGAESTGHAPPPLLREYGPLPFALSVAPGEAESVEELAALVGQGIYVTRLHYLSIVDPREGVITGMTRDGTFRIQDGRLAEPLVNLRFTVAVPDMLAEVPGLTREPALVNQSDFYGERFPFGVLTPAIATARFNVTGVGSAPGI
jgi:predicted Zn-dependent protease